MGGEAPGVAPRMGVGFNYMWPFNHCGFTLGTVPYADGNWKDKNPAWRKTLPRNLADLKSMGFSVVRMWLLANGYNYGKGPSRERVPVIGTKMTDKWHFEPPDALDMPGAKDDDGTVRKFEDHFKFMMDEFKKAGMKFIPSLLDFAFIEYPEPDDASKPDLYIEDKRFRPGGRYEIFTDPKKRDKFFETVLDKFLAWSKGYEEQIFAWEVINEPYWNLSHLKPPPHYVGRTFISKSELTEFLQLACKRIEAAGFASTVGHRYYKDCLEFPTGTIAQYHYYYKKVTSNPANLDPEKIPEYATAIKEIRAKNPNVKDVFVGEFGIRVPKEYPGDLGDLWDELKGKDNDITDIVFHRLDWLQQKGYKLALFWPDKPSGDADYLVDKCHHYKFDGVCKFTGRQNPFAGGRGL